MTRHAWALGLALALGCGKEEPVNPDAGTKPPDNNNANSNFTQLVVDSDPSEFEQISSIALAVGPEDRIGMAYFVRLTTQTMNAPDYALRYREFNGGTLGPVETVAKVQRVYGVSVAFGPNGQPAVTYLGGVRDATSAEDSTFWYQSDLAVAYRNANGTWTERIVVRTSGQAVSGNALSDGGWLVGLNPSMVFSGNQALVAYRDGHRGNFGRQDWEKSDVELAVGGPTAWQHRVVALGGDGQQGYGGHLSLIMAGAQPAVVHDTAPQAALAFGSDVVFQRRNPDGLTWTAPVKVQQVGNTQLGSSMAYDAAVGFGIAVLSRTDNRLTYIDCDETSATKCTVPGEWSTPDPVYNSGTGGWYPSLAFNPVTHEPSIAYYICALAPGRNDTTCEKGDDKLVVATRVAGVQWNEELVDAGGGWSPKLAYLSNGKRIVLYRAPVVAPDSGVLKLSVEK